MMTRGNHYYHNDYSLVRVALFLIFSAITMWLTAHHEMWRDEADAWLMARDAPLIEILRIAPNVGNPALWYFLLKPLAYFGAHPESMQWLNLSLMILAVASLVFFSSLSIWILIPVLFSFPISYEYPVVARNYALGILGLFAYAPFMKAQHAIIAEKRVPKSGWSPKVLVESLAWVFICFSSVHFLAFAVVILAWQLIQDYLIGAFSRTRGKRAFQAFAIIVSIWILWPSGHGQFSGSIIDNFTPGNFIEAISSSLFPYEQPNLFWFVVASLSYLAMATAFIRNRDNRTLFGAGALALLSIFVFKYYGHAARHACLLLVWLIFCMAVAPNQNAPGNSKENSETNSKTGKSALSDSSQNRRKIVLSRIAYLFLWFGLFWNTPTLTSVWALETHKNFSDAKDAAKLLNDTGLNKRSIICWSPRNCTAILPHLKPDVRFWYPVIRHWGTYNRWDFLSEVASNTAIWKVLLPTKADFPNWGAPGGPIVLSHKKIEFPEIFGLRLFKEAPDHAWRVLDESFWIYVPATEN